MKEWFTKLSLREQIAVLVMSIALAVYVVWWLLIVPQGRAIDALVERNRKQVEVLHKVESMVSEIGALRAESGRVGASGRTRLVALLNDSANRYQLRLTRLQPNSRGAVQLRFDTAALEPLLRWLYALENDEGLIIEELSLNQTGTAGVVSASVRVAAAS